MATIYAGPGKVYMVTPGVSLQAEGVEGKIVLSLNETTADYAAGQWGHIGEQPTDQIVDLTFKPFDQWILLPALFPAYLGCDTSAIAGGAAAALKVGTRPHAATVATGTHCKVWTWDGRLYDIVRAAIVGIPSLHLGTARALFGDAKIVGLPDLSVAMGSSGYLITANAITESGGTDPDISFSMASFVREAWTGAWGAVTGFTAIQAEEEWTIETTAQFSPLKVQGRTLSMQFDSIKFMAKCRPFGPTHTQIVGAVGAHLQGQRLGAHDLVLTSSASAKTITLNNSEIKGAGFDFGGTVLGTGEIGFVQEMQFSAGAPTKLIQFSA
jgi:hypothetical protein